MDFYRALLPDRGSDIYETILSGLRGQADLIRIPPTPPGEVNRILRAVLADHPELPWATGKWQGTPGLTEVIRPRYGMTPEERAAFQAFLPGLKAAGEALRGMPRIAGIRRVFDFLLGTVIYDLSAPHSQNAYGALVERRAVCRGIAKAFQLLAGLCGIPAVCVEGSLDGESLHVWNIVITETGNYHTDVSMGYLEFAFLYETGNIPYNKYCAFCVSDETLRKTHRWDPEGMPLKCDNDAERPFEEV